MLYLDANATTPPDPAVVEAMLPFLGARFGNPSAAHDPGRQARRTLEQARGHVANLLGAEPDEIVFTSGGTEGINAVHLGARAEWPDRPVLVTGAAEHAAGLECARRWQRSGGEVRTVAVDRRGVLQPDSLRAALVPGRTALVSLLWANNETGTIAPMRELVEIAHAAGAAVHADAVQAAGKMVLNLREVPVDYLSLSGHKMHAPQGIGALYIRRKAAFHPLLLGGGQENGRRSGTENLPGAIALGRAAELALATLPGAGAGMARLRDRLEAGLLAALPDVIIHGLGAPRLPNTSSIAFPGSDAAGLLILLDQQGLCCSGGSACHSAALHPSHVLEAMGFDATHAASTLRFSLSRFTTEAEIDAALPLISGAVRKLRALQAGPAVLVA
jgi:cysteine desulfurase